MGYSYENIQKVKELLANRRSTAVSDSFAKKAQMSEKLPGYAVLEEKLSATGTRIMEAVFSHTMNENVLAEIRADNERLRREMALLLTNNGYPADYTDIHYACELCSDTGYNGIDMCTCMREELIRAGIESAGIASLIKTQTFDAFSLDFYENCDRILMEKNVSQLRYFAEHFSDETNESWLFTGATGLGKTHLSTAVAKEVISRGFDVIYDTVQDILEVFEEERFSHGEGVQHKRGRTVEGILACDLLIVDDLGTEMLNQFSLASIYNMINTRINRGKPTIINTNLTQAEIRARYSDRIASRLFGEFRPLLFKGLDIRAQKLKKGMA